MAKCEHCDKTNTVPCSHCIGISICNDHAVTCSGCNQSIDYKCRFGPKDCA